MTYSKNNSPITFEEIRTLPAKARRLKELKSSPELDSNEFNELKSLTEYIEEKSQSLKEFSDYAMKTYS